MNGNTTNPQRLLFAVDPPDLDFTHQLLTQRKEQHLENCRPLPATP